MHTNQAWNYYPVLPSVKTINVVLYIHCLLCFVEIVLLSIGVMLFTCFAVYFHAMHAGLFLLVGMETGASVTMTV